MALTWGCVDFGASHIVIKQTFNQRSELKETKTSAGMRSLYVDADTMAHLRKWKAFQAKALHLVMVDDPDGKKHPIEQTDETPACCDCVGAMIDPPNLNRWWAGKNP